MNKSDLIDAVARKTSNTKSDTGQIVDAVFESITLALEQGDQVSVLGFGTFLVRPRAERSGRNPQTGEIIKIKAAVSPVFKAGKALKEAVQKLKDKLHKK